MSKGTILALIAGLGVGVALIVLFSIALNPFATEPKNSVDNGTSLPFAKVVDNATEKTIDDMTQMSVVKISGATTPTVLSRQAVSEYPLLDELVRDADEKYAMYAENCKDDKNCEPELYYYETKQSANITISDALILIHTSELHFTKPCFDNGACVPDYFSNIQVDNAFYQVFISDKDNRLFDEIQREYNQRSSANATPDIQQ